jgi:molecular chaperone GrpE (heat shock protein)
MAWQPGQSGNPNGAPKRAKLWRDAINRAIKRREETDPQALEKLADKLLSAVDTGDVSAMKEFGDRVDGKVPQAIVGDDDQDPVTVRQIVTGVPRASDD